MQSLALLIVCQFALAAPAEGTRAPAARQPADTRIAEYERLSAAERRAFVERLIVERLAPAARWALSGEQLEQQLKTYRQIESRLSGGSNISARGLARMLRKLDTLEHEAINRLSRRYRIEVYSLFHSQRQEYEQRIGAWKRAQAAWESAGRASDEQRKLIDWLLAATEQLRGDRYAGLPAQPRFGHAGAPRAAIREPAPPEIVPTPPRVSERPVARPSSPPARTVQPEPTTPIARRSSSELPDLTRVEPRSKPEPAQHAAVPLPAPRPTQLAESSRWITLPPTPLPRQSTGMRIAMRPVEAPPEHAATQAEPLADPGERVPGRIDLDELSVRIAGHNLALARLAGRLQGKEPWTTAQLADAISELEDLAARRGDLLMYVDLISEDDRKLVGTLQTASATLALLGRKVAVLREALAAETGLHEPAHDERFLALDQLSRRLAQLAPTAPPGR